jgi:hypothetical protein
MLPVWVGATNRSETMGTRGVPAQPVPALCRCYTPQQTFVKNINREFNTTAKGTTSIYNKHGNVTVNTWAEKKVKFEITITVNAGNPSDASKVLDQLNVNFINTNGYVKAETVIGTLDADRLQDFKVNYKVWIPTDNQLELSNRYGDSELGNLNGNLTANIKYGDLKTGNVLADVNLKTEFCKAVIPSVQNLYGWANDGQVILDNAKMVQLETERSTCTFRRAEDIRLTSRFDQVDIGVASNIIVHTKYGSCNVLSARSMIVTSCHSKTVVDHVSQSMNADLQSGGLEIKNVQNGFEKLELSASNAVVKVNLDQASYCYELSGNNTRINLPSSETATTSAAPSAVKVSSLTGSFTKQGCFGETNTQSKITAKMNNGALVLH